jgi:hypothetical protein
VAQQSLRGVLSFCNARQRNVMQEFRVHVERVLTVLVRRICGVSLYL